MGYFVRIEVEHAGTNRVMSHGICGHYDKAQLISMLRELVSSDGYFHRICGDEVGMTDFQKIDDFFVEMTVVVPHPFSVAKDPDVEFDGGCQSMGQGVAFELGSIDQEVVIDYFPGGCDMAVDLSLLEEDFFLFCFFYRTKFNIVFFFK